MNGREREIMRDAREFNKIRYVITLRQGTNYSFHPQDKTQENTRTKRQTHCTSTAHA